MFFTRILISIIIFTAPIRASYSAYQSLEARGLAVSASVTPLISSVSSDSLEQVRQELRTSPQAVNAQDAYGRTALFTAAQHDKPRIVQELLKLGTIQVDKPDIDGFTPLMVAADLGNADVVEALLTTCDKDKTKCPNVNIRDIKIGYTPLMRATTSQNGKIVKLLLEHGANSSLTVSLPEAKTGKPASFTALDLARRRGNSDIIKELEKSHKIVFDRALAFMKAISAENFVEAQNLLRQGIDINAADSGGATPLHWASMYGQTAMVDFLIKQGADVNKANAIGSTPLHWAALEGHLDIVKLLVAAGADVTKKNEKNTTALEYAARSGRRAVTQFLKQLPKK